MVEAKSSDVGKEKVGNKRRRDEEEEEDVRQQAEEEEEDVEVGVGGEVGMEGEERGGGLGVDAEETVDEVVTSGAEGDIESAAEVSGDGGESDTRVEVEGDPNDVVTS